MAAARAAIPTNPPQDVFTPAQLLVEAERVLKQPQLADAFSANQKQQLCNVLLEFSETVENIDGRPVARKVEFVARTLTGTHDRSPVSPIDPVNWRTTWMNKFDNNPGYRQGLRAAVITFYGAVGLKKAPKTKSKTRSKSKSRNRRSRR
jgi:hypothetical protein